MSARHITVALAVFLGLGAACAQQTGTTDATSSAPAKAPCVQKKRHDHGAERYLPTPQSKCKDAVADTQKGEEKPLRGHDHGKTHKLM